MLAVHWQRPLRRLDRAHHESCSRSARGTSRAPVCPIVSSTRAPAGRPAAASSASATWCQNAYCGSFQSGRDSRTSGTPVALGRLDRIGRHLHRHRDASHRRCRSMPLLVMKLRQVRARRRSRQCAPRPFGQHRVGGPAGKRRWSPRGPCSTSASAQRRALRRYRPGSEFVMLSRFLRRSRRPRRRRDIAHARLVARRSVCATSRARLATASAERQSRRLRQAPAPRCAVFAARCALAVRRRRQLLRASVGRAL